MTSSRKREMSCLAAVTLTSGLFLAVALTVAAPAAAEEADGRQQGGATATLDGLSTYDEVIISEDGEETRMSAGLFEMSVYNGGTLQTYGIDLHSPAQGQAAYQEVSWNETSLHENDEAGKIRWIVQNSYPQVNDLAVLAQASGASELTPQTAAAGTQAAIWRYSDGAHVTPVDEGARKLADYLERSAQDLSEPKPSLTLGPPAVSGKAGERVGPITVSTNAQTVSVVPGAKAQSMGVQVVDESGQAVTSAVDGTELYLDIPADAPRGTTSLTAQGATGVPVGRTFNGMGKLAKSQAQILAGSSESAVSAAVTASWADKGPVAAVSAKKNCAHGGVDVTAANRGDERFVFTLAGKKHEIAADDSATVTVPVQEDQSYRITIAGPDGFKKTFHGVLDCRTASSGGGKKDGPSSEPSPATVGGGGGSDNGYGSEGSIGPNGTGGNDGSNGSGRSAGSDGNSGHLAETGSSSSTPLIAGIAVVLVVLGAVAMFAVSKRKPALENPVNLKDPAPKDPKTPETPEAPENPKNPKPRST